MQGSIFTAFSDMVIEQWGIETWNELLVKVKPLSEGIYTSGMQYDDSEMMSLMTAFSEKTRIDKPSLLRKFAKPGLLS